jgi:MoxR-like ATPase
MAIANGAIMLLTMVDTTATAQASGPSFPGLTPDILATLNTPGVAERWAAVQQRLHPALAALADLTRVEAARRFPREWPLYEVSFKSLGYVNRGGGRREPIDEYHFAIDRPPRGAGVYIVVDGVERQVIVGLQVLRARKNDLREVWERGRIIWQPLVERITDVRFSGNRTPARQAEEETRRQGSVSGDTSLSPHLPVSSSDPWLDRYLAGRSAMLFAGFAYTWDDPQVGRPEFALQVIEDVLALLPLNEAIMEQAEALEPHGAALLRERRASYTPLAHPPIETIIGRMHARGFALSDALIRAYHVALQTKPLVILPGISGTGKTRLTRLYADAVYGDTSGQENPYYLIVAVQPDWHNARDLLGYYNAITNKFHPTPFLRFLHRAASDPASVYFICLDEMNLARPEYYLAPILSALETEDHQIDIGAPTATVESVTGEVLQNPFRLPLNVRITGTVNVDESAYALSDKLLDRANVIELTDVDLDAFRRSYREPIDDDAWRIIVQVHAILTRAGQPFGYRTISEMLRYIERGRGVLALQQALDQQIKQKILPKLRGDDTPRLRRALTALLELLTDKPIGATKASAIAPDELSSAPFPDSAEKVRRMLERLEIEGFTDFYG